jgi:assimilatory nitrate reductase catalytic subunit
MAHWHGVLLRGSEQVPAGPYYWARVPIERGHAFTLTGWEPLPSDKGTVLWVAALLDASPAADVVIYADPARKTFRYASIVGRRLAACLFIAADAALLPPRDALAAMLGTRIAPEQRAHVLAGGAVRESSGGPTICACFGVGLQTLNETIASKRLTSVAEIGATLRAGTNCGSCIPELQAILDNQKIPAPA